MQARSRHQCPAPQLAHRAGLAPFQRRAPDHAIGPGFQQQGEAEPGLERIGLVAVFHAREHQRGRYPHHVRRGEAKGDHPVRPSTISAAHRPRSARWRSETRPSHRPKAASAGRCCANWLKAVLSLSPEGLVPGALVCSCIPATTPDSQEVYLTGFVQQSRGMHVRVAVFPWNQPDTGA